MRFSIVTNREMSSNILCGIITITQLCPDDLKSLDNWLAERD